MILLFALNAVLFAVLLLVSGASIGQTLTAGLSFGGARLVLLLLEQTQFMTRLIESRGSSAVSSSFFHLLKSVCLGLLMAHLALAVAAYPVALWKLLVLLVILPFIEIFAARD